MNHRRIRIPQFMTHFDPETSLRRIKCEECGGVANRIEEHGVSENGETLTISTGFECTDCGKVHPS